jgi:LPS sulfotransferase NodH
VKGEKTARGQPRFDPGLIEQCLRDGEEQEKIWQSFFQRIDIEPFRVEYEKLCADYEHTICGVLNFLKISLRRRARVGAPLTIKQSDEVSHAWEERFLKEHSPVVAQI